MEGVQCAPLKMGKSPQIWKSLEIWKWLDIGCVGSVRIGIFILTCVETRKGHAITQLVEALR